MNIAVAGCDARYYYLAEKLSRYGHNVKICGTDILNINSKIKKCDFAGIYNGDLIVLPLPVSKDKIHINLPCLESKIKLADFFANLPPDISVFGGGEYKDSRYTNYCDGNFVNKNSILTAEGALFVAMQNKKIALFGAKVLCVGFGHLGRAVCKVFRNIGCKVTATARKQSDFEDMVFSSYTVAHTSDIADITENFDIVVNTVPHPVITESVLQRADKNTLFLELASAPYGIDFDAAEKLHLNAINLPALPSKYAPVSAGELIADTVQNILLKKESRQ